MGTIDPQKNKTTQTSFQVLDGLVRLNGGGVTDLAQDLGMPKSTVYKHLATLRDIGYVKKDGSTYDLGAKFVELNDATLREYRLYRVGQTNVEQLARATGDVVGLFIEENDRGIDLFRIRGNYASKNDITFINSHHLHASAAGKAILSQLSEERRGKILDRNELPQLTEDTITDRAELIEQLEVIRDRGVAFECGEQQRSYHSIATPISSSDTVLGSIYVAGPPDRLSTPRMRQDLAMTLGTTARDIERRLADNE
ncbi:IclR family transcriptional regulator [Saliphagus infecundisoli]|uniref:IclR family transcriptional regulator n=1 Tax=Saliphagus infecundisoli TaxID=1849069 RepID=A0ABD5QB37_9EURY|nr:IclR family transcriptional regulator [Saliphagus infecundisoli]